MDDDTKDFKRGKPQQKLYKPGSGPLRRSDNAQIFENKMDLSDLGSSNRGREQNLFGSQVANDMDTQEQYNSNFRHRKPEQQLYIPRSGEMTSDISKQPKHSNRNDMSSQYNYNNRRLDKHGSNSGTGSYSRGASRKDFNTKDNNSNVNYNRQYRQVSEPRSSSPAHCTHNMNNIDRNRDSRSMETSAGRNASGTGGKPPSGRRNSAGYSSDLPRPKYINLDNIPPRFRKKYLEQSGYHSYDNVDQLSKDQLINSFNIQHINDSTSPNWSQTLPSRGRGRLRDNENFDREKFVTSYLKNYELDNSRKSTPSSSYMNLYEPNSSNKVIPTPIESVQRVTPNQDSSTENGINDYSNDVKHSFEKSETAELQTKNDIEGASSSSTNLLDNTSNLDWTEEVEKNIKLDDTCDSSVSYPQSFRTSSVSQDVKPNESREPKKSGRNGRRRDKRSLSRGKRNSEKRERNRKDSNVSIHEETSNNDLKHFQRERRDSHRSNRSSTIGNSRDDLDRWRSLRSYSREQSTEGRIVSQCNSRDTSISRAISPRDSDGFRVPNSVSKGGVWSSNNQKKNAEKNGSWSGRTPSIERGRRSPINESGTTEASASSSGSGHRSRKTRSSRPRRRARAAESAASQAPAHNPPAHQQPAHHPPAHHQTGHHTPAHLPSAAPSTLNWREEILESKKHMLDRHSESTNQRNKTNGNTSVRSHTDSSTPHPGLIVLPPSSMSHVHKDQGRTGSGDSQKLLYDYNNPSKPIVVQTSTTKMDMRMERPSTERSLGAGGAGTGSAGGEGGEAARAARHRALLQEVERADALLQAHSLRGPLALADHWHDVSPTRKCLQNALQKLLMSDLKYCQSDNVEHNFWKILYYNFIEILRDSLMHISAEDKPKVVNLINTIIEEGNTYFESLVHLLEQAYTFNTDDYINDNHVLPPKGLGYVGLALISVQKLYIFLGDLARYKEQVNGTHNYAKSKFWYTRAQLINPKNGRPYNQLAILAIYARRKLDAVYYYMRSLMSSNPFQSARESLLSLFDENRKKYEAAEKKRRAAAQSATATEGESAAAGTGAGRGYRREVWVRPSGRRTTTLSSPAAADEDLYNNMTPVELNKNFITTYLHVHGKLITKIGMETFHESARQMLHQFRALLHRQPLPTPAARLLQLTALNMFAVETTASACKDSCVVDRSAWLEGAVGVSLLMFGALLERCCALLPQPPHTQHYADALLLLPAIKVWSDWMLCHSSIWNPPPSFDSFQIENEQDPWDWLAKLMNILEDLDDKSIELENEPKKGDVCVRLGEDAALAGFTPLMYIEPAMAVARVREPEPAAASGTAPAPAALQLRAEHALRTRKILFFGTEYLVGVEPPVLRLEYPADAPPRYVSAVQRAPQTHPPLQHLSEESEEEEEESARLSASGSAIVSGSASARASLGEGVGEGDADADEATRRLLRRVHQLETRRDHLEKRRQRVQEILSGAGGWVSEEVEVRPRWLVPDTNCFIDHLPRLRALADAPLQPYTLVVPLVVVSELEGLGRCSRRGDSARAALAWVTGASGGAAASVKFATSRGSVLPTAAFAEGDAAAPRVTNDDRVLATALALHANLTAQPENKSEELHGGQAGARGACRSVSVVLLTDDRNLRVKALAADLPARDLRSFVHWAQTEPDSAVHK